jgi:transcriptional regulator with XRE-family HTH domain
LLSFHEKAVEVGTPVADANAERPPNLSMISETVMEKHITENRNVCKPEIAGCVIYRAGCMVQQTFMLTTGELLSRLEQRGIKNHQVAKALGVSPSRVTEMRKGERAIKLDEAAKLVSEFGLEEQPATEKVPPLQAPIARLIVTYVAGELGLAEGDSAQLEDIAQDVRAFAEFVSDPAVRESIDAAETFFQAMRLRRPRPEPTVPQGNDHQPAN